MGESQERRVGGVDLFFAPRPLYPRGVVGRLGGGGQLEAQARVVGAITEDGREMRETLRSPLNKRQRDRGQGTWSFTERRSRFNGMVIREGGPGLGKGGGQGEVQLEWR